MRFRRGPTAQHVPSTPEKTRTLYIMRHGDASDGTFTERAQKVVEDSIDLLIVDLCENTDSLKTIGQKVLLLTTDTLRTQATMELVQLALQTAGIVHSLPYIFNRVDTSEFEFVNTQHDMQPTGTSFIYVGHEDSPLRFNTSNLALIGEPRGFGK
jgi:phosphohistidine phosphatase SixA